MREKRQRDRKKKREGGCVRLHQQSWGESREGQMEREKPNRCQREEQNRREKKRLKQ